MSKTWNKISVIKVIAGLAVVCAGIGMNLYATNQLNSLADQIRNNNSFWTQSSALEMATQQNPTLHNMLDYYMSVVIIGAVVAATGIILFAVQRLLIRTIDNRIKEANSK